MISEVYVDYMEIPIGIYWIVSLLFKRYIYIQLAIN